jgi:hypothetical protein
VPVWIEVPAGMQVTGVTAEPLGVEKRAPVRVVPVAPDVRVDEAPEPAVADPAIYGSAAAYPGAWAELASAGTLRGHAVVCVLVAPARWTPATGELEQASAVRLALTLAPGRAAGVPEPLVRRRVVAEIEAKFEAGAAKLIRGFVPAAATEGLGDVGNGPGDVGNGPAGPGPYQPTFRPTGDGSAVEYVIVTSAALAGEFQRLADWKTQKGVQGAVRTVEWIDQTYPNGVDRAERIRFFIRDAYQNWGTLFVLLGGDTDVIPPRYGVSTFYGGENIPTDIYYGCLDGNWNADGDDVFGEGAVPGGESDDVDFLYDVSIGRAPVSTLTQADTFIDKVLLYEQNPPALARYPASILTLAERLFPTTHGAELAEEALVQLPPWIRIVRMYEESASWPGSIELTKQAAIDSINAGFGIVHHVGHGYRNTMSVGNGTLNNADSDALVNGPKNSVVFAINCSSASIDFNSIGERWVKNPNGGSIVYIGTSRLAFVTASRLYQDTWFNEVWNDSTRAVGLATDIARAALVPGSGFDGPNRWNLMATTLLGDPEVDIYTNGVVPIQVSHPATVALGAAPITVTVTSAGSPVAGAMVTVLKAGETYARAQTGASGLVQIPIGAQTPGFLTLTVHKSYYRPYVATIGLTGASGPYVFVQAMAVDDDNIAPSMGDGDGQADAGETVELRVTLRNGGSAQVTGVTGTLSENDPENAITILQNTVNYGTIGAGGSSQGSGAFLVSVGANAPVAYQPLFTVTAVGTQGTWPDVLVLPLRRPYLEHHGHVVDDAAPRGNGNEIVEAGEEIYYRVTLRNAGLDRATVVTGTLRALRVSDHLPHPGVTVTDANASFGTLVPGAQVEGDRFAFTLSAADPATVLLELTLADALGPADLELLDVIAPAVPDSFNAFGSPSSIRITWKRSPSADARGYDVYRAASPGGPFARINSYTVDGTAAFEDGNLPGLTRYYYQVVARDSSYNASVHSVIISGTTNPPYTAGWPIEIGQQTSSSVTVADLDHGTHMELFCGADMQYAWHGDATEVQDGDDDPRTSGPFSIFGRRTLQPGFGATQAVGDVDGDGYLEVANVSFSGDSLFVWDFRGALLPGWPKTVLDDYNWGSVLMADLDASGDLEIVCWAGNGGRLFAWHHTGQEIIDGDNDPGTNGVLARVTGTSYCYGSPAVAQLDADPQLEILVPVNYSTGNLGAVHAFNINSSAVPGWPFLSGNAQEPSQVSSSIAVADVNRDGSDEVLFAAERDGGKVYVLNGNGTVRAGWPRFAPAYTPDARLASPVVADLNGDGYLDVVFPDTDGGLHAWDRNGSNLPGFPVAYLPDQLSQTTQSTPAIGDIDGDGLLEILFGDERGRLNAYNHDGTLVAGFPIQTSGEVRGTPGLWDVDRDNLLEVALASYDAQVYVWDVPGQFNPTLLPWPFFRHDTRNSGRYSTPVQQVGIDDPPPAPLVAAAAFHPARPNPFNPATRLAFDVPGEAGGARHVELAVYDVNGRLVRRLLDGMVETGHQAVAWDGRGQNGAALASGVYFARIQIGDFSATQKLTMLR